MLWLLIAEIRKLVRPLVWGTALAIVAFCLLITWGAANNARAALASPRIPDVCAQAATAQCNQVIAHAHAAARAAATTTSQLAQPGEIGHVAAGMLASVPGLLLIAMIAGGHWGGEWGSRTIRQLLSRESRRGHVDGDGLHPSAQAHARWAEEIDDSQVIQTILRTTLAKTR